MIIFDYIKEYGLKNTWEALVYNNSYLSAFQPNENIKEDLLKDKNYYEITDLYEESLAYSNKLQKKENGQYYTPDDVCDFLVKQIDCFDDGIWCDPCCGLGNISYKLIQKKPELLNTMLFCDIDELSIKLCKFLFSKFFNKNYDELNNFYNIDFLKSDLKYDYIIMNPPYAKSDKEDLYISFMKKACECKGFISITPQSFTSSIEKSSQELREKLLSFSKLKIYIFDNVPGMIFNGKKKGIFNTNTSNSVRTAVTICNNTEEKKEITPMIRWKTEQRKKMFENVDMFLSENNLTKDIFLKIYPDTQKYLDYGNIELKSILSSVPTEQKLTVPSTLRYFITASIRDLNRSSKHILYFNNEQDLLLAYIHLNSSYSYWWWRINDGGITLTKTVLENLKIKEIPLPFDLINMLKQEEETNLIIKTNAGKPNENIKHSFELIKALNDYLGFTNLEKIQSNSMIEE